MRTRIWVMLVMAAIVWGLLVGVLWGRSIERDGVEDEVRWTVDEQTTTVMLDKGEVDCVIRGRVSDEGVVRIELIRCGEGKVRGDG